MRKKAEELPLDDDDISEERLSQIFREARAEFKADVITCYLEHGREKTLEIYEDADPYEAEIAIDEYEEQHRKGVNSNQAG